MAVLAGSFVRGHFGQAAAERTKSTETDVVTSTDLASERMIRAELLRRCPGSTVIGEEYDDDVGTNGIGWIVDPIDGTVNFLYDLPVVAVSIAATIDGEVVAGAVADVLRGEVFAATRGEGARRDGVELVCVGPGEIAQALVGTGFAYDSNVRSQEAAIVQRVLPICRDIRCMGSAALNLCWVACGRLNAFYERAIQTYDYAAGALIASEAGAVVELPADNLSDLTIAATPDIFEDLRRVVAQVGMP